MPTWRRDWPWDLLIDILNATRIGNWWRRRVKGRPDEEAVYIDIRGINADLPRWMPESILASITRLPKAVTMSLVPLHNPAVGSKLRNKIRENLIYSQTFKQNYRYSQTYFEIPKIATTLIRKITPSIKRRITILIHKFHRPNHSEPK